MSDRTQPPPSTTAVPADLAQRAVARLLDFILLAIVNAVIVNAVVAAVAGTNVALFGGWGWGTGSSWAANAITTATTTTLSLAYFTLMETTLGQTVGKMLLKIETRGPTGGDPTVFQALKRNAFLAIGYLGIVPFLDLVSSLLSLVAVVAIAITINSDTTTRRGWHDRFAGGTMVVRVG